MHKNTFPGGHEIYSFGKPSHSHHYYSVYILSLSDLCSAVEKIFFKRNNAFLFMTYMATP